MMPKRLKGFLCTILYYSAVTPLIFWLRFRKKRLALVLLYHRVCESKNPFEAAVSPREFEKQMRFIAKHTEPISIREMLRGRREGRASQKPLTVITFDDGYRDNYLNAYPILKRYSLPAAFF